MIRRDELLDAMGVALTANATLACVDNPIYFTTEKDHVQRMAADWCMVTECPVLLMCRAYGIENPREYGVYGGRTDKARQALARKRVKK